MHTPTPIALQTDIVLAGPILRRLTPERVVLWLATRIAARARLALHRDDGTTSTHLLEPGTPVCRLLSAGAGLHYLLIDLPLASPLEADRWTGYELALQALDTADETRWLGWREWAPDLAYPGRATPGFIVCSRVRALLHGSCRKPHHRSHDALVAADALLARCLHEPETAPPGPASADQGAPDTQAERPAWPAALVLSGDQIYADDVAGPMLRAIHALIARLDLPTEALAGAVEAGLADTAALLAHPATYYRRETLLPSLKHNRALIEILFGGVEKPVFTADTAHNHLISLGEMLAMYLLVWSPVPWQGLAVTMPEGLAPRDRARYAEEARALEDFVAGLPAVRRLLAHLPVAMIFDDHDITDDWNLNRAWEETAYGHPFSTRVIGNALIAYLINQAWGNRPEAFDDGLLDDIATSLAAPGGKAHDDCIQALLRFERWHYEWPTSPPLVVLDTRTRRWRSEGSAERPSGLLDWEAITDLQQTLRGQPAVLLVSPAPIFGVKLIEAIQRVFTWFGKPLMVDAENWMAHPGAAHAILNVFRHPRTPGHFVVLSGDVHYSFVYDIELRGREHGPDIWQICASGLRNTFPNRLLAALDHANRWLYSPRSPLNWFTRRRQMRVIPRKPEGTPHGRRLLNAASIGLVELDEQGTPWRIRSLLGDGRWVNYARRDAESHWD